jgi:general stress protein YciG
MEREHGTESEGNDRPTGESIAPGSRPKQRRGFAAMDPNKQKAIASLGGRASHAKGTGHEWNADAAREAGRKGGLASRGGRGRLPPTTG